MYKYTFSIRNTLRDIAGLSHLELSLGPEICPSRDIENVYVRKINYLDTDTFCVHGTGDTIMPKISSLHPAHDPSFIRPKSMK
jgi:hypothetical protein